MSHSATLGIAFKEWAAICLALAEGRQALILRKGGISEENGAFRPEHPRFWLYPTYSHQQQTGLKPEAAALLATTEQDRPAIGCVRLSHFVEVGCVRHIKDINEALSLRELHLWSDETVRMRYHYREPGLFVLAVRVVRAVAVTELRETTEYAGCRSWVPLERALTTEGATPVLNEEQWEGILKRIRE